MSINNVHQQCPSTMCRSFFLRPLNAEIERLTLLLFSLFPLWCLRFSCSLCHRTSPHFKSPHSPRFLNEASFYVALKLMAQVQNHQTLGKRHTHTSFNRAMCNVLTPLDLTPCNTDIRALNNDPSIQCPTFTAVRAIDVDATCWLYSSRSNYAKAGFSRIYLFGFILFLTATATADQNDPLMGQCFTGGGCSAGLSARKGRTHRVHGGCGGRQRW